MFSFFTPVLDSDYYLRKPNIISIAVYIKINKKFLFM